MTFIHSKHAPDTYSVAGTGQDQVYRVSAKLVDVMLTCIEMHRPLALTRAEIRGGGQAS